MERIEKAKQFIINRPFRFLTMLNTFILLASVLVMNAHFENNDDMGFVSIFSGAYGISDFRVEGMSSFIGMLCEGLIHSFVAINWYTVFLLLITYISFSVIFCVCVGTKDFTKRSSAIFTVLISLISLNFYVELQFTRVSSICFVAAFILLLYSYEKLEGKKQLIAYICGGILTIVGSMIRYEMLFSLGLIFTPAYLIYLVRGIKNRETRQNALKFLGIIAITGAICLAHRYVDRDMYSAKDYNDWKVFFAGRIELMDHGWPDYDSNRQLYDELEITPTSFTNYVLWDLDDPNYISIESMDKLIKAKDYSVYYLDGLDSINYKVVFDYWINIIMVNLYKYSFFPLLMISGICALVYEKREKAVMILSFLMIPIAELMLAFMQRGLQARVDVGLFAAVNIIVIYFSWGKFSGEISSEKLHKLSVTVMAVLSILFVFEFAKDQFDYKEYEKGLLGKQRIMNHACEDSEHVYVSPVLDYIPLSFSIWNVYPMGYSSNVISMGGWMSASPLKEYQKKINNIGNVYSDLIDRDDVYLMMTDGDLDLKLQYLREHYNPNVYASQIKKVGGVKVYKICTEEGESKLFERISSECLNTEELKCDYELFENEDGNTSIMGNAVMAGMDSFTQDVILCIPDKDSNERFFQTVQLVNDAAVNEQDSFTTFYYDFGNESVNDLQIDKARIYYRNKDVKLYCDL